MNRFLKALLISLSLYISHILLIMIVGNFYREQGSINYGIIGSAVYIFIVAFWAYYLLTLIYLLISHSMIFWNKLIVALIILLIGYTASRTGDIIDGDFIERFRVVPFLLFVLSSILIVLFDNLFHDKRTISDLGCK